MMTDIDALVADLKPVRRIDPRWGLGLVLAAAVAVAVGVVMLYGARADIAAGAPHPLVIIRGGALALLGLASALAATASALPAVGRSSGGWRWALASAALLPLAAVILLLFHLISGTPFDAAAFDMHFARYCVGQGGGSALVVGAVLTLWLRRGAPTALDHSGWLVGLAAGSFGVLAYSLHCPSNSIYYVGLFYSVVVAACAVLGRLIVPHLLRW